MNQGFILLHRKIRDNQLWPTNKPFTKMEAWVDLLLMARYDYEPCEVLLGKEIIMCRRGQVIRSTNTYQKRWNWGAQRVKSFFEILLKLKQISKKTTTKTTIITILNYDSYQSKQQTKNKPKINGKQTKNKPKTIKKESINKDNKVNNKIYPDFFNENLIKIYNEFLVFRIEKKKTITETQEPRFIEKLEKLSRGQPNLAAKILIQSIENGWQGIFELKTNNENKEEFDHSRIKKYNV